MFLKWLIKSDYEWLFVFVIVNKFFLNINYYKLFMFLKWSIVNVFSTNELFMYFWIIDY